jgi:hypothetical protein
MVLEACTKFEDLYDVLIDEPSLDDLLSKAAPFARSKVASILKDVAEELQVDGWWKTISQVWGNCINNEGAMSICREAFSTIVGPGARMDLVEEALVGTALEVDEIIASLYLEDYLKKRRGEEENKL